MVPHGFGVAVSEAEIKSTGALDAEERMFVDVSWGH